MAAKRKQSRRAELVSALLASRVELRNGQVEMEFARDSKRTRPDSERLAALMDSTDRVIRGHEQAIQAIDAAVDAGRSGA